MGTDFADFDDAIALATNCGFNVAWSNQSFEYWLCLHFDYLDEALDRNQYCTRLSAIFKRRRIDPGGYRKNMPNIYELVTEHGSMDKAIEFAKVTLLSAIDGAREDGYEIVEGFLSANPVACNEIERGRSSAYIEGLLSRYSRPDCPAWAFMEVISFGTFCHFYRFCAARFDDEEMRSRYYLLMEVKNFRNACAHNYGVADSVT